MDLLLTGRTITGAEAGRIGLAQYVSSAESVLGDALTYASEIAARCSPASLAAIKDQVYTDLERGRDAAQARTLALMFASFAGPDLHEAVAARSAGRAPGFPPLAADPESRGDRG